MIEARGLSKRFQDKKRVDSIFNRLDMNGFRDRRCDKLSTGMKQKTSIARTLVHDPPVMIFDEPTNGLDVMTARTITAFIHECRNNGKTVIFSTHIMSEVESSATLSASFSPANFSPKALSRSFAINITNRISRTFSSKSSLPTTLLRRSTDMSARNIGIVYRKELTEALRDRRTLITMFVLPLIIFPLLSVGFGAMISVLIGKAREERPKVMVIGGGDSPGVLAGLKKVPKIQVVPLEANWKDEVV